MKGNLKDRLYDLIYDAADPSTASYIYSAVIHLLETEGIKLESKKVAKRTRA